MILYRSDASGGVESPLMVGMRKSTLGKRKRLKHRVRGLRLAQGIGGECWDLDEVGTDLLFSKSLIYILI